MTTAATDTKNLGQHITNALGWLRLARARASAQPSAAAMAAELHNENKLNELLEQWPTRRPV